MRHQFEGKHKDYNPMFVYYKFLRYKTKIGLLVSVVFASCSSYWKLTTGLIPLNSASEPGGFVTIQWFNTKSPVLSSWSKVPLIKVTSALRLSPDSPTVTSTFWVSSLLASSNRTSKDKSWWQPSPLACVLPLAFKMFSGDVKDYELLLFASFVRKYLCLLTLEYLLCQLCGWPELSGYLWFYAKLSLENIL